MKKGFKKIGLGVMLIASFCVSVTAQAAPLTAPERQAKEKVQIVVVEKRERDKSGGEAQRDRSGAHKRN